MRFQQELVSEVLSNAIDLITSHFAEVSASLNCSELDIDINRYEALEEIGLLRVFTVRDDDGALVGYASYVIASPLHSSSEAHAYQDALYLRPDCRRGTLALRFIQHCDKELQRGGIMACTHNVPVTRDFGKVLERAGYQLSQYQYTRRYDDG